VLRAPFFPREDVQEHVQGKGEVAVPQHRRGILSEGPDKLGAPPMIPLPDIRAAAERLADRVHRTPLLSSAQLGARAGARLHLKCESLQKTGSFKARGALNKVLSLSGAERERGLVTVSAGNHAAAVAWAAQAAGCAAVVVMPEGAPASKVEAVRGYGAEVVLHGDRPTLFDKLNEVREARGLTFVHPFDD